METIGLAAGLWLLSRPDVWRSAHARRRRWQYRGGCQAKKNPQTDKTETAAAYREREDRAVDYFTKTIAVTGREYPRSSSVNSKITKQPNGEYVLKHSRLKQIKPQY